MDKKSIPEWAKKLTITGSWLNKSRRAMGVYSKKNNAAMPAVAPQSATDGALRN